MITLHHLEKSQSIRILWLLEELGVPYEIKLYDRDPKTRLAPAEYKAISPLGTAPVITDDGLTLAETNAIVDYICDKHDDGRLRPAPGTPMLPVLVPYGAGQSPAAPDKQVRDGGDVGPGAFLPAPISEDAECGA